MGRQPFVELITQVTREIAGKPLDTDLESFLNKQFPADGQTFRDIESACHTAVRDGWMCEHEHGGIQFGRVIKPTGDTAGYSVDVVRMNDIAGPHHRHPNGEIDMIMPLSSDARFDGKARGWLVYGPDSAHAPTVTGGEALVLYLLPDGAIEFTRKH